MSAACVFFAMQIKFFEETRNLGLKDLFEHE